jgi:glycine hydroxymethyltransferase
MDPSGIRLGSAPTTTRGMKEPEMELIADLILKTLKNHDNAAIKAEVQQQVLALTAKFPLYPELN